jgi:hypothetical protein
MHLGDRIAGNDVGGPMSASRAAYDDLLATLRTVGDRFAGTDWGLTEPVDVAEGLRVVIHILAIGLETQFEDDPAHPVFRAIVTPWRKALGDNADARYHDAAVHPAGTYRVRGRTAGAAYVSITVEAGAADGAFPSGTAGSLNDSGFDMADDGSFEVTVGGPARDRGWLALPPDASRITVRHYWEGVRSPHAPPVPDLGLTIELVDGDVPGPRRRRRTARSQPRSAAWPRSFEPAPSTPFRSRARAMPRRSCPGCRTCSRRPPTRAPTRWPRPTPRTAWRPISSAPTMRW